MDYTQVLNFFQDASLYDLYRMRVAIQNELQNPRRIYELRQRFAVGDPISYFDGETNALIKAVVLQKSQKYVFVRNIEDNVSWKIPYYMLNLSEVNSDIQNIGNQNLTRNHLKVGDRVGFNADGKQYIGVINRLNFKTVTLITQEGKNYRVSYNLLFRIIEGEKNMNQLG